MGWAITSYIDEFSLTQILSIVVTFLLGGIVALLLQLIALGRREIRISSRAASQQQISRPAKLTTRRICDIPLATTEDQLRRRLEECLENSGLNPHNGEKNDIRLTFARSSRRSYMATITSYEAPKNLEYRVDTDFIGVTPLFESCDANVDIIAVSGLGSHAIGTFKAKDGNNVWLRDFLPEDVPKARVLVYGYDTTITKGDAKHSITDLAMAFLGSIKAFRLATETSRRPIIFVGHSLGGLLIKAALSIAYDGRHQEPNSEFFNSSYALVFFGVPNLGLNLGKLEQIIGEQPNKQLVHDLQVDNESEPTPYLAELKTNFIKTCRNQHPPFRIISYFELRQTLTTEKMPEGTLSRTGPPCFMVTRESAYRIGLEDNYHEQHPLDVDHSGLVKFSSQSDDIYTRVLQNIKDLVKRAPHIVEGRFSLERELSPHAKCHWRDLNRPDYAAFKITEKVAKPENGTLQWLVTEDDELLEQDFHCLRSADFFKWRDSNSSSSLLITAAPGQGKSVLSNFVVNHLKGFSKPGGKGIHRKTIYYFCNVKNEESSRTASFILRALIVQLCRDQRLFVLLPWDFQKKGQAETFHSAPFDDLWSSFDALVTANIYDCIYCVIDGLDVYQTQMLTLLEHLNILISRDREVGIPLFKLFCTSRPQGDISDIGFSQERVLRASPTDLELFIKARLKSFPKRFNDEVKKLIFDKVINRTDRTFLWVSIVLRELRSQTYLSIKDIGRKVESIPEDLGNLYKGLLKAVYNRDSRNIPILAWITFAKRPLHLEELEVAIAVGLGANSRRTSWEECSSEKPPLFAETIREMLGTLVDVIDDRLFLIHQSLRDFLQEPEQWQEFSTMASFKRPELLLANACINYLSLKEFEVDYKSLDQDSEFCSLLEYASTFWYQHIHTPNEAKKYMETLENILKGPNSKLWTSYRCGKSSTALSPCEIAIRCDIGWLANILLNHLSDGLVDVFDENCLAETAKHKPRVFKELLNHPETRRIAVTEEVIKAVADNFLDGKELMLLLLDRRGSEMNITEAVVQAAAKNWRNGKEIMLLLLDRRGTEVEITEQLFCAIAENFDQEVMLLLLDRCGREINITEAVVQAAAKNSRNGNEVMLLLLDRRGSEVQITEQLFCNIAKTFSKEAMLLLLDRRGSEINITEAVVQAAAKNSRNRIEVMLLLLDRRGSEVEITEAVIQAAARNTRSGKEIMLLLLNRQGNKVAITEELVCTIARKFNEDIMQLLLDRRGSDVQITEAVVQAAARNIWSGKEMMLLLLNRQGSEVKITEAVILAAARNGWSGEDVILLLLDRKFSEVKITEELVCSIVRNFNKKVVLLLLERRGSEVHITEGVVQAAVANWRIAKEVMLLLLDRRGSEVRMMEEAVCTIARKFDEEIMQLLLDRQEKKLKITEAVIQAAAQNKWSGKELMLLLLDQRRTEVVITEKIVKAAVGNEYSGKYILILLLEQRGQEVVITEEVVKTAVGNGCSGNEILMLLLKQRGTEVVITEEVVKAAVASGQMQVLKTIEERLGMSISKEQWLVAEFYNAAAAGDQFTIGNLLAQGVELDVKNSRNMSPLLIAAKWGFQKVVQMLLDSKLVDVNSADITGRSPLFWAALEGHKAVVKVLLERGANPNIVDEFGKTPLSVIKSLVDVGHPIYCSIAKMLANGSTANFISSITEPAEAGHSVLL